MQESHIFKVNDIFYLGDGKTVFAVSGVLRPNVLGKYALCVAGEQTTVVTIQGDLSFSPRGSNDIAIFTLDPLDRELIDLNRDVILKQLHQ